MKSKSPTIISPKERTDHSLNRREILKVLAAAGGGLTAAAFLPGKWLKPVIESGVLPAHAQASCILEISGLEITCDGLGFEPNPQMVHYTGSLNYSDSCCELTPNNVSYHVWSDNMSVILENYQIGEGSNSCTGTVQFTFWAIPPTVGHGYLTVGSRESNILSADLIFCRGGE